MLEDSAIPMHVVATDLLTGATVRLSSGTAVDAVLASCAIPAIYPPVRIGDRQLIDAAVASNTPIRAAVELGATRLIVLPTRFTCPLANAPPGVTVSGDSAVSDVPPEPATPEAPNSPVTPVTPATPVASGASATTSTPAGPAPVSKAPGSTRAQPQAAPTTAPVATTPPAAIAPVAPAPQKAVPAPATAQLQAAPLDLKSLETRLRQTKAIGVLTKLSLKKSRWMTCWKNSARTTSGRRR